MNKTLVSAFIAAAVTFGATAAMANTQLPLDPDHTSAQFSIAHLTITKVSGSIPLAKSHLVVNDKGIPVAATASFDLTKLTTQDEHRDTDLKSDKWFNTAAYPMLTFKSTAVRPEADGTFAMSGLLSFHGVTKPVTLQGTYEGKATDPMGHVHLGYTATGKIDRTEWGVGQAPAALVGNDVSITINAEAIQP